MSTWSKQIINQIAEEKRIPYTPLPSEHIPYLGLEHIEQQSLRLTGIGDSREVNSQKKKFSNQDILYGSLRPYFRKVYLARFDGVCSTDITVLSAKNNNINSFLFYLIASKEFIDKASSASNGTKMPRAGWNIVKDFEFKIPDIPTQTRIASVLSTYDDLIENNEQRIKILEEMAQFVYTEWFVRFKFPGYEKIRMVDSGTEYGKIPEGWEVAKVGDRFSTILGGTPSRNKSEYWNNGEIPWINSGAVNNLRITKESELITRKALEKSATKMLPKRTTLLAITGATLGQVSLTEIECCANQSVVGIHDKEGLLNEYIYLRIKDEIKRIIVLAGGGAQQHINKDIINNKDFLIPEEKLIKKFSSLIVPLFDEISALIFSNTNLSQIRDLLITQLVTGRRELK